MIALQYLGPRAARREQGRPAPARCRAKRRSRVGGSAPAEHDPLEDMTMRLTYRTARVLECVPEHPLASNRRIADQRRHQPTRARSPSCCGASSASDAR